MKKVNKILALLLSIIMVLSITPVNIVNAETNKLTYTFDEAAHNSQQKSSRYKGSSIKNSSSPQADFGLLASYVPRTGSMIENEYLQFYVGRDMSESEYNGRFTIGNTGGNPNFETDDNQILL